MLSITPVSAGDAGVDYLLRQAGCGEAEPERQPEADGPDYYLRATEHGEPAGVWIGNGLGDLGLVDGSTAGEDAVRAVFGRLQHPETGEQLGRAPRNFRSAAERLAAALEAEPDATPERRSELEWRITAGQRKAVGYFDLTFSPAKSVSVYYAALRAAGRFEDAEKVWAAHREGVTAAVAYMEREAGYSRRGYHGRTKDGRSVGEYVAAREWVGARFDHTTNREGEPQLHSHVEVLNRVRCEADGAWRTLDGKALYQEKRAADSIYELTLEEAMMRDLPARFAVREDGKAREIVGITQDVRDLYSTRSGQVDARVAEWAAAYEQRHGHTPGLYERDRMADQAALSTRRRKSEEVLSATERDARWGQRMDLSDVVGEIEVDGPAELAEVDRDAVVAAALHRLQQQRATWRRSDLMLAIKQHLPGRLGADDGPAVERFLTELTEEALRPAAGRDVVMLAAAELVATPGGLLRESDGRPLYRPHRDERFATAGQLDAEQRLVATAVATGAPAMAAEQLVAVEAELVSRGLAADQRAAVLGILGSGRRGDVLIGPAGSGKSYTVAALAEKWSTTFGPVVGLATGQSAANVLAEEGLPAVNVARFLTAHEPDPVTGLPREELPAGALLVIDETGMSATEQLDRVRRVAAAADAKLLWTGDHEQLDAVGAGGALRLLVADVPVFELAEARRFAAEWEREASLGLRRGDRDALRAYDERGRLLEGDAEAVTDRAYQAYLADTLAGRSSLLLVGTNDDAAQLSARVRAELVRLGRVSDGPASPLRDGTAAAVGDLVQTRLNAWDLVSEGGRAVANRDIWRVVDRDDEGALAVQLDADPSVEVALPAGYVAEHVTLAYASTSHAAQGRTVDTGHALVDVAMTRGELYPNMTRGRDRNTAYVVTQAEPDDENGYEALDSDRVAVLSEVLDRDTAQRAAVEVMRDELEAAESLATLGTIWQSVVTGQSERRYGAALAACGLEPDTVARVQCEPGAGRLWRAVRCAELAGHDPDELLATVVADRELDDAASVSDVLRWRIRVETGAHPQAVAATWAARTPEVADEVGGYTRALANAMDARQAALGEQAAAQPPEWAAEHLGPVPDELAERAEWTERAGRVAAYREMYDRESLPVVLGPAPSREEPEARAAWDSAYDALGAPEEGRDYAAAGDDELRAMVTTYAREQVWAPQYVANLLAQTERRVAEQERRAVMEQAEAEVTADERARNDGMLRAERAAVLAAEQRERAAKLEEIHTARAAWIEETAASRHAAELAERELRKRHPEPTADVEHQAEEPAVVSADQVDTDAGPEAGAAEAAPVERDAVEVELAAPEAGDMVEPEVADRDACEAPTVVSTAPVDLAAEHVEPEAAAAVDAMRPLEPELEVEQAPTADVAGTEPEPERAVELPAEAEPLSVAPEAAVTEPAPQADDVEPVRAEAEPEPDAAAPEVDAASEPTAVAEPEPEPRPAREPFTAAADLDAAVDKARAARERIMQRREAQQQSSAAIEVRESRDRASNDRDAQREADDGELER